jgi:zinc transport system ATP-binding protein
MSLLINLLDHLMTAIDVKHISVFRDGAWALDDISFELNEREMLGVIGMNGGGKSTLLKTLVGLIKPDKGTLKIFGKSPKDAGSMIGYMQQETAMNLTFPIRAIDVVKMGFLSAYSDKKAENGALEALDRLGALHLAKKTIGSLSGGERQRVFIARALVGDVKLLLLDEPTANIDIQGSKMVLDLFRKLKHSMAILCVSHDRQALRDVADRILTIHRTIINEETITADV